MNTRFKMQSMAAAVAIALVGPAMAGVDVGLDADGVGNALLSKGGELFVTAFDSSAKKGYFYDLGGAIGRTTGGLLLGGWNNTINHTVDLSSQGWGSFVSLMGADGLSNVKWMVGSSSNHYGPSMDNGLYRAVETTASEIGDLSGGAYYQQLQGYWETFGLSVNGQTTQDVAENSFFATGDIGAIYNPGEPGWADGWSSSLPGTVSALLDAELDMYRYGANATEDPLAPPSLEKYPGVWKLTSAGTLTYTVDGIDPGPGPGPDPIPGPVPVPAAVWLLGSALLGVAGVSRRNKRMDMSA